MQFHCIFWIGVVHRIGPSLSPSALTFSVFTVSFDNDDADEARVD